MKEDKKVYGYWDRLKNFKVRKTIFFIFFAMVIICILGFTLPGFGIFNQVLAEDDYDYVTTPSTIFNCYMSSSPITSCKYEKQNVKITGTIESITIENHEITIVLVDPSEDVGVTLFFTDKDEIAEVAGKSVGDVIVAVGRVQYVRNDIELIFCNNIE